MNLIGAEEFLKKTLKDIVDEDSLNSSGSLIYEMKSKFGYNLLDVCEIFHKCPAILKNTMKVMKNISKFSNMFNLTDVELKRIFQKLPSLFMTNAEVIKYKLNLIAVTYGCSLKDAIKLLTLIPELLNISKPYIIKQNEVFTDTLNQYGLKYRTVLRAEPMLLFVTKNRIEDCKKCLMKNFTLSEEESQKVLINSPSLIVKGEDEILKKFNFYYPKYFIKRDLKEILTSCPDFLSISETSFEQKLKNLKENFYVDEKKLHNFIRIEPDVLYFNYIPKRFDSFIKYNINSSYLLSSPKLCLVPEISIPLKFIITRILGLDDLFTEICMSDTNLFISRFLFMQKNDFYQHKDLVLTEEKFYEKYNISSRVLKLNYNLDYDSLKNICAFYIKSKESIKNWGDILFPELEDILEYIYSGYNTRNKTKCSYQGSKETYLFSKREYGVYSILKSLQMSDQEIVFVFNRNKAIGKHICSDTKKIIDELRKFGYSQEQIIKLLMTRQHLFNYSILDFTMLINQIIENQNCSINDAIDFYL